MPLFDEWAAKVAKEKIQRKTDHSQEPLSACLWIVVDMSDSKQLRERNESVLNKLFTMGRHSGQRCWVNVHALSAVSPLIRKNAAILLIFKTGNHKEYDMLGEEYAHLVGKDEFDELYKLAVDKVPNHFRSRQYCHTSRMKTTFFGKIWSAVDGQVFRQSLGLELVIGQWNLFCCEASA